MPRQIDTSLKDLLALQAAAFHQRKTMQIILTDAQIKLIIHALELIETKNEEELDNKCQLLKLLRGII